MSLFNTLQVGASGMGVSSLSLGVIGDNISNLNTVGYKRSYAHFADSIPQTISSLGGMAQLGTGAMTGGVGSTFAQGGFMGTGSAYDLAVGGNGFFQVASGAEKFYTRDGSFHLDAEGYLVTAGGYHVQGYGATDGTIGSSIGDLQITAGTLPPQATSNITLAANLDASTPVGSQIAGLTLDGSAGAATLEEISGLDDVFTTSVTVFDSLGRSHDVSLVFEKTADDTWTWNALVDGGEVETAGGAGTSGAALSIGSGTVSFDTEGNLVGSTVTPGATAWTFPGAADLELSFDMGADGGDGSLTAFADDTSSVTSIRQDGMGVGELSSTRVDPDGTVYGVYTNGEEKALGQVALATFASDAGLERTGANLFRATSDAGEPALGVAGSGGRGDIYAYSLERSNVELEDEFVQMIQAQRAYQSSASVVRTGNETLQTLIQLV